MSNLLSRLLNQFMVATSIQKTTAILAHSPAFRNHQPGNRQGKSTYFFASKKHTDDTDKTQMNTDFDVIFNFFD